MSYSTAISRINQVQAKIRSLDTRATQAFDAVLQEKLGVTSAAAETTSAATAETATDEAISDALVNQLMMSGSYQGTGIASGNSSCEQCLAESGYVTDYTYNLPEEFAGAVPYMDYINEASERYGMPVNLIVGIMKAESNFSNECVSSAGAKGLMQLMPETAAEVGVTDEFDPRQNILGSVEYVTKLINRYDGDVRLALAAYNTGPGKISRYGVTSSESAEYFSQVPQSIRDYADRVLRYAGYVG